MRESTGEAVGKIILMGEHAVVYNMPAIALPFPQAKIITRVYEKRGPVKIMSDLYKGDLLGAPDRLSGLTILISKVMMDFNQPLMDLSIEFKSEIPPERGMGSSAAVAASVVRALFAYFQQPLSEAILLSYVDFAEKINHGNPSGLDARITVLEQPLMFIKGRGFTSINLNLNGYLIAADTGIKGKTKEAVAHVQNRLAKQPDDFYDIKRIGMLVNLALTTIEQQELDQLGALMNENHTLLKTLGVSHPLLDEFCQVALDHGAIGAKLTGGGMGGVMIALAKNLITAKNIASALKQAGAAKIWIHQLED